MAHDATGTNPDGRGGREPVFLLPGIVTAMVAVLVLVHLVEIFVLDDGARLSLIYNFAFLPLRIVAGFEEASLWIPLSWTLFTHALLHDGWEHLLVNCAWLLIFATPVARRYGAGATLAIFLISAAAGALAFAVTSLDTVAYLLGASGGVSGLTGAAVRFMFQPVLVGVNPQTGERRVLGRRLLGLRELLSEPRARAFFLIWTLLNAAVPILPAFTGAMNVQVAWQAHLGGFFAGLLLVGLFERSQR